MQYRNPVGLWPSGKTCPKCAPHLRQETEIRLMPKLMSSVVSTFCSAIGSQKLGQPVPDSNFVSERKRAVPQQMQRYRPLSCWSQYAPVNARSVPSWRVTVNDSGESCCFHSPSLFTTLGRQTAPLRSPASENSTISTSCASCFDVVCVCSLFIRPV